MIKKETFSKTINFLKEREDKVEEINKLFTEEFEDSIFYPYSRHDRMIVELLSEAMDDRYGWIEYFLYETDYGRDLEPDSVQEADGTPIDITTPEKLYDLLAYEHEERKRSRKIRKNNF